MESERDAARERLAALDRTTGSVQKRMLAPWWYYVGVAVLIAGFGLIVVAPPEWHIPLYLVYPVLMWALGRQVAQARGFQPLPIPTSKWWWLLLIPAVLGGSYLLYVMTRTWGVAAVFVPYALLGGLGVGILAWREDRRRARPHGREQE